jgi:hypothetical protein
MITQRGSEKLYSPKDPQAWNHCRQHQMHFCSMSIEPFFRQGTVGHMRLRNSLRM